MVGVPGRPGLLRALNDASILGLLIDHGPLTRAAIAARSDLSKPTVAESLTRLQTSSFVVQSGDSPGRPGPNGRLWAVRPHLANSAAVRITQTQRSIVLTDVTGTVIGEASEPRRDSRLDPAATVKSLLRKVCSENAVPLKSISLVVVGVPGTYDRHTDEIALVDRIPEWTTAGVAASLETELKVPVSIENDANLALVAEQRVGTATEPGTNALLWLGAGLGLAIDLMHSNSPFDGAHGRAGEIGYLRVPLPKDTTGLGNSRKPLDAQDLLGGPAITRLAKGYGVSGRDPERIVEKAVDSLTKDAGLFLAALAERITLAIAPVAAVLDPDLVVLGGPIGRAGGERLAEHTRAQLAVLREYRPQVAPSTVVGDPVLVGAQLLAVDRARDYVRTQITTDATDAAAVSGLLMRP